MALRLPFHIVLRRKACQQATRPSTSRQTPSRGTRARPAFSLIELLTVLTLIGIIVGFSANRVSMMMAQHRVARAAQSVQNTVESAFSIAGRNRRPITIRWTSANRMFSVTDRAGTTTFRTTELGDAYGVNNSNITFSSNSIEVFPNGLASDTLLITISTVRNGLTISRRVHVSRAGLVRID
jgi:prepilin-type N-terminal cleavage/methylation domain-containing protein